MKKDVVGLLDSLIQKLPSLGMRSYERIFLQV